MNIHQKISAELNVAEKQVNAAIALLDEGSTVPFIARYRKEVTGGLDDIQLRTLQERLQYLREMEERRTAIISSIEEQEKMTPALLKSINEADTKTRLEDLYLPYKKKRRTKGQIAIEAGIEPLADALFNDPSLEPLTEAEKYINTDDEYKDAFKEASGVLDGAKFILMERFAEDADLILKLREYMQENALLISSMVKGKEQEGAKFRDYFDAQELIAKVPSHRGLAMLRGRKEGFLRLKVDVNVEDGLRHPCEARIAVHTGVDDQQRPSDKWLAEVVAWTWRVKMHMHLESELISELRTRAEESAIHVFAQNLKDLLLAAPAGQKNTMGLDPGFRTGVKVAIVDHHGKYIDSTAIYPHPPQKKFDESIAILAAMVEKYDIELIAVGNGTASRETETLCKELIKRHPKPKLQSIMVSEAGASVYSASETAAKEFPELDVTIRGAISIARRLQDPLAELVKIEPKAIGVGQYQHDVSQLQLAKNLDAVVEDCVNGVGVEVNSASADLLRRVAGLNQSIANNIIAWRDEKGSFKNREDLKSVPRLGDKAFEQAAGFLRIRNGNNPLDASAVHPESYALVNQVAQTTGTELAALVGNSSVIKSIDAKDFVTAEIGLPTITDIFQELEKPGRDPRPEFKAAKFKDGVEKVSDLKEGMILEGAVTNVTDFGAFVDVGVHQDGLVHISVLANKFVKDPREIVKAGDIVKVKVVEVDLARQRIALSMRLEDAANSSPRDAKAKHSHQPSNRKQREPRAQPETAFANAFAALKKNK